jgi:hypothetical protein
MRKCLLLFLAKLDAQTPIIAVPPPAIPEVHAADSGTTLPLVWGPLICCTMSCYFVASCSNAISVSNIALAMTAASQG